MPKGADGLLVMSCFLYCFFSDDAFSICRAREVGLIRIKYERWLDISAAVM